MTISPADLISHLTTTTAPLTNDHWKALIAGLGLKDNEIIYSLTRAEGRLEDLALLVPSLRPGWAFFRATLMEPAQRWVITLESPTNDFFTTDAPSATNALFAALLKTPSIET